jgi:hypothetical protein
MNARLLIITWFKTCLCPCFHRIWSSWRVMLLELVWMFFVFFNFFYVWFLFDKKFEFFCFFFFNLIHFKFWFCFWFSFQVKPYFWFDLWLDQRFHVNLVRSNLAQRLRPSLADNLFGKSFLGLSVFDKYT